MGQGHPAQFPTNDKQWLRSPLSFRSIFGFTLLFLLLTGGSGFAKMIFGSLGFLVVIVVGALACAASSSVLVGQELARQAIASSSVAMSMLLVTVAGLLENVVLLWAVTRQTGLSLRLFLFTLPIVPVGVLTAVLIHLVGSWN